MNIFILNTGRCGSTTFIKACEHITNYSSAHESLSTQLGEKRLDYPNNHIEADNRLSWFLGRLDEKYTDAFYVHLTRNPQDTIESFSKREKFGIMKAYKEGILLGAESNHTPHDIAEDYLHTIESNINLFLKTKPHKMRFKLETATEDFNTFWSLISAEGNLSHALAEWNINYNKTPNSNIDSNAS